jgi:hypothetical protein
MRHTTQKVIRRLCSMRRSIKMLYQQNGSQFTSFQRSYSNENCALLGNYAASSDNFLPTFRDNLSAPSSRVKNPKVKPDILVRSLYREECGHRQVIRIVVPADRVDARSWEGEGVG